MAIRQRGNGWQADVQWKGRRERGQFDSEQLAHRWVAAALEAMKAGRPIPDPENFGKGVGDKSTLDAVYKSARKLHWDMKSGSGSSVKNARVFVEWAGANLSPAEVFTESRVAEYVEHLVDIRQVTNATINRHMAAISVLQRFAKINPPVALPRYDEGKGRIRFFSDDEEALIFQTWLLWGKRREVDLLTFLLDTGARPWSEATAFTWKQQGTGRGYLAGNGARVTFDDTKNGIVRTLPLTRRAIEAVARQSTVNAGPFTDIDKFSMDRLWQRTRSHLPQLKDTVIYTARHTCASRLVIRGIDIRRVKDWMGHSSITTTMRYAHLAPDSLLDAVSVLEGGARLKLVANNG